MQTSIGLVNISLRRAHGLWTTALVIAATAVGGCTGDGDATPKEDAAGTTVVADGGDDQLDADQIDVDADSEDSDAELDAGESDDADADASETAAPDAEGPIPVTVGQPCKSDKDCSDSVYCNGEETCQLAANGRDGTCRQALSAPCPQEHHCLEDQSAQKNKPVCDCSTPDYDQDGQDAIACGGRDCDDTRDWCNTKATEVCDTLGLDEDCLPDTYHTPDSSDGDRDGDGYIDSNCFNVNAKTKERHGGDDCDDHDPYVSPHNPEVCNYKDDNCNGKVDEVAEANGTFTEGGLRAKYLPDLDRDGHADKNAEPRLACDYLQPPGYLPITKVSADDCNDTPVEGARIYPTAVEKCDKIDNDCDGLIDAADSDLEREYSFPQTDVSCVNGEWQITCLNKDTLFCPGDNIARGCSTDATRLSSCRACQSSCQFSCGQAGCDEIVTIEAGAQHACALTREGRVACWGRGEGGRLGNDSVAQSTPSYVVGITNAKGIAVGSAHACAIVGDERALYCWGHNDNWQLGSEDAGEFATTPVPVRGLAGIGSRLTDVAQVAAGDVHTCAVMTSGALVCFGQSAGGLLGDGRMGDGTNTATTAQRIEAVAGTSLRLPRPVANAKRVALGVRHGCIVTTADAVECWGANSFGQLALPSETAPTGRLTAVAGVGQVSALVVGDNHSCVIANGTPICWGTDGFLELGRADTPDVSENWTPKPAAGLSDVTSIAAGSHFTCAGSSDGRLRCWGGNSDAQLGPDFTGTQSATPMEVPAAGTTSIALGVGYGCALDGRGVVRCWGTNTFGEIGSVPPARVNRTPLQIQAVRSSIP